MTAPRIVVTGTDTGIGKTVFAAGLAGLLGADYWKPVQAGLDGETDSETVARLARAGGDRIHAEAFRLKLPASPHFAAASEGIAIEPDTLEPPATRRPLVIEGAGGVLVPLTETTTFADLFARWGYPVVLCARTALGTINHTLLSLEALRRRGVPVLGVAFIGEAEAETERILVAMGGVPSLGRLPRLQPLSADTLAVAFSEAFRAADFRDPPGDGPGNPG